MRLIDVDELIKATQHAGFIRRSEIEAAPTVDAEPVIRCEECGHWGPHLEEDDTMALCWAFGAQPVAVTPADGYCYRAERRENNEKE